MKPHIIGIAGPSSSGKTSLASRLAQQLNGAAIVSLDSYYRELSELPLEERAKTNFDHPDALEWEILSRHLAAMASGKAFDEPVYSFAHHTRTGETRRIEPAEFMIVEGLFVLYWPELRSLLETKIYVRTDLDVCFRRRLARDVAERGRTPESVYAMYERTVRPGAEAFVCPTAEHADLIVSGEEPFEQTVPAALAVIRKAAAATGVR